MFFHFHANLFQRHNRPTFWISGSVHNPISALTYAIQFLKLIHISTWSITRRLWNTSHFEVTDTRVQIMVLTLLIWSPGFVFIYLFLGKSVLDFSFRVSGPSLRHEIYFRDKFGFSFWIIHHFTLKRPAQDEVWFHYFLPWSSCITIWRLSKDSKFFPMVINGKIKAGNSCQVKIKTNTYEIELYLWLVGWIRKLSVCLQILNSILIETGRSRLTRFN